MRKGSTLWAGALAWAGALTFPALTAADAAVAAMEAVQRVEVVGTAFRLTTAAGRVLTGLDLVGAVLTLDDPSGERLAVRIDAVRPDPKDPTGETTLYTFMAQDPATGAWANLCAPDADGLAMGFPLSGVWTPTGEHRPSEQAFSLTCTSGALGKCVRLGYKPWQAAADGTPLGPYHQACVRMIRADYCGDGAGHTRDGTPINIADRLGLQVFDPAPALRFEAAWGPDGAVCVHRVRLPEVASLEGLVRACPGRLAGKVGAACTEGAARHSEAALLLNASEPRPD
jgi:hypothetical protein